MLYKMSNPRDIPKILEFGKASGTYLIHILLPELSDLNTLYVFDSFADFKKIEDELPPKVILRADAEIGMEPTLGVRGCEITKDKVLDYLLLVKKRNPNGAVLCINIKFEKKQESIEGSFNVHFEWGKCIIIDYLGLGFDIAGITKGEDSHESYYIPWDEVLFVKYISQYRKKMVSDEEYSESVNRKINFLMRTSDMSEEQARKEIPSTYRPITKEIHRKVLEDIIVPILLNKDKVYNFNIGSFGIQGMIRKDCKGDYALQPIEIRTSKRHVSGEFYSQYLASEDNEYRQKMLKLNRFKIM